MKEKNKDIMAEESIKLTIVFVILKITNNLDWSWWWIMSPIIIEFIVVLIIFILILISIIINDRHKG